MGTNIAKARTSPLIAGIVFVWVSAGEKNKTKQNRNDLSSLQKTARKHETVKIFLIL